MWFRWHWVIWLLFSSVILNDCFHSLVNCNMWTNAESARLAYYPLTDEWNLPSSSRWVAQPSSSSCHFHWVSTLPPSFKINIKTHMKNRYKYKTHKYTKQCFPRLSAFPNISPIPFDQLWVKHPGNWKKGRLWSAFQVFKSFMSEPCFFQTTSWP